MLIANRKPMFLINASICFFQVAFGLPLFLLTVTSKFSGSFRMLTSFHRATCPYHLTAATLAILSIGAVVPSICFNSLVFFRSTSFTPHIALIKALSVLIISLSLKHHVSLPYSIADLTQI